LSQGTPAAVQLFEKDVESTLDRLRSRVTTLESKPLHITASEENNMSQEEADAFNSFPRVFQDALQAGDMAEIDRVLKELDTEESNRIMTACTKTGLIKFLNEEEVQQYSEEGSGHVVGRLPTAEALETT